MNSRTLVGAGACMVPVGAAALASAAPAGAVETRGEGKIAFISGRTGGPDLFVMHDDGSHQRNLTPGTDANEDAPCADGLGTNLCVLNMKSGRHLDRALRRQSPRQRHEYGRVQ